MRKTSLIVSILLLVGLVGIASAQETLPKGGDDFETAVELELGNYVTDHDISRKTQEYFKLPIVKAGQMLVVKATNLPTGVDLISNAVLFNEARAMLVPGYDNPLDNIYGAGLIGTYKWLPNSSQDSYGYYISIGGGDVNFTAEGTKYDISIEDKFDAGSQTDAGDTFEKAMDITLGEYKAYLSGKLGTDTKDFYKVAVNKGETLTAKVTPPSEARMKVVVYDSNRGKLKEEYAPNPGAIITNSLAITRGGDVFVEVSCDKYCSNNPINYTLNVAVEPSAEGEVPVEEGPSYEDPTVTGKEAGEAAQKAMKAVGKGIVAIIILWIVVPIILLVTIGIVVYFLLKKRKTNSH